MEGLLPALLIEGLLIINTDLPDPLHLHIIINQFYVLPGRIFQYSGSVLCSNTLPDLFHVPSFVL